MSAYYDPEQDFVVVALGAQPCVNEVLMEKPSGGAAANAECNGIPETGHRAAAREDFNFAACCHSQRVGHSADEETSSDPPATEKKPKWVGLGLCYALLSCLFFSVLALLVKKIEGIHALEISGIRCLFQWLFTFPIIIYNEEDILGPKGLRLLLFLRGLLGATAMMLLFYAIQQMHLADATVIMFSNPVFVSIFAWIFLKEKCTLLDPIFISFTLVGVVLIARPQFLFGSQISGFENNYKDHIRGTAAAFASAICVALTLIVIRKMGKSVNYFLSIWYYSVVGSVLSMSVVLIIREWSLPFCGMDRAFLILIGILGIGGQAFLTKALQIEKAASVALIKTMEVVLAFILQYLFLNRSPTWWSLGGALCVTSGTSGVAIQKWYTSTRKGKKDQN
ncbi:solute carrier family 35 member G1 isoform X1 [Pristis pectinata]|uniref:solute carrier family 35 member G1 isoform X1 n=1 Tax=Pristis pectinata TaxID=685728 RepID=UPI00223E6C37|nr:solute carrier family 35 member G1 isoform X1 [Pristis pectinata]